MRSSGGSDEVANATKKVMLKAAQLAVTRQRRHRRGTRLASSMRSHKKKPLRFIGSKLNCCGFSGGGDERHPSTTSVDVENQCGFNSRGGDGSMASFILCSLSGFFQTGMPCVVHLRALSLHDPSALDWIVTFESAGRAWLENGSESADDTPLCSHDWLATDTPQLKD